ncbi:acyltransferase family protein [Cohnella sp.]|uniref:acyltransferase family protein n=1 Tax=Cohnella sp. TaxID=1883426 RepID=UPI0035639186
MKERFAQLDALRGLASLSVLLSHVVLIVAPSWMGGVVYGILTRTYSPFQIFVNGHSAVILFFVLSGFVLSLPLLDGGRPPYFGYILKRFFRIYVPYLFSFFVAMACLATAPKLEASPLLSDYFKQRWTHNLSPGVIFEHVLGIVNVHTEELNSAYWSLVHEMRISIFFPFVVLLLRNVRWYYTVVIGLLMFGVSAMNDAIGLQASNGVNTTYFHTFDYLSLFLYGMLLAKHRADIVGRFRALSGKAKYALLAISLVCYNSSYAFIKALGEMHLVLPFGQLLRDQIIAVGVVGFVVIALASRRIGRALLRPVPLFLGHISYSLYLYHMVIYFTMIRVLMDYLPLPILLLLAFVVSIAVAYLAWTFIEKPMIALGRHIANRLHKRTPEPLQSGNQPNIIA